MSITLVDLPATDIPDVVKIVKLAASYLSSLLEARAQSALLEEVEHVSNGGRDTWQVTFSLPREGPGTMFNALAGAKESRDYKVVSVDAATGGFLGLAIRKP